jgi:hypothetical protein
VRWRWTLDLKSGCYTFVTHSISRFDSAIGHVCATVQVYGESCLFAFVNNVSNVYLICLLRKFAHIEKQMVRELNAVIEVF